MKRKVSTFLFGLLFLAGFGIMAYPTISNQWNTYRQSKLISNYDSVVKEMSGEDFEAEWEAAKSYNQTFEQNSIRSDVFGIEESDDIKGTEYWKVLNVAGDGIMGYLTIPKINVRLSIYHGTNEDVIQTGVGHLNGTKLPIGGKSNHSVLSAHRGLPSAKLFTDIDQLKERDRFYLHILDEDMAYEVDQILIVEPTQMEALNITAGKDYCTLLTCTPYGINSHRMFVRGHRIDNIEEEKVVVIAAEARRIPTYYVIPAVGIPLLFVSLIIMLTVSGRKRPKKTGEELLEEFKKNNGYK